MTGLRRVMCVEDDPDIRMILEFSLATVGGYEVRCCAEGHAALAQAAEFRPDLVLLDVMMPRMSGFEVCQKLKGNPSTRDIVIIMVTALHEVSDMERAVECGCDDFVSKPVNKVELLARVKGLLALRLLKKRLADYMRDQRA